MIWVRKGFVFLLSLLLFITLLGTASSTSTNVTLGKPEKVETYLAQSKLYDHFVAYVADQASKSEGGNQSGSVSLNDAAVQAAARSSFGSKIIQKGVNTFIDANYAWLQGKVSVPKFKIDLSAEKADFAQKVGQHVKTYTAGLPVCTSAQAVQQQLNTDPLAATCRPPGVKPAAVGAQVTQRLSTTSEFLNNPVITPNSVNPKGNEQNKPYYQKLSKLPKLYRLGAKLPYIFGALSVLFALGIIFLALTRRRGIRRLGIVLGLAGIVLVASKFVADIALKKAENQVFNNAGVGQLQESLTDFAHRVESSLVRINLWFGVAFLVLALIIFIVLLTTRDRAGKKKPVTGEPGEDTKPESGSMPLIKARRRLRRPFGDSIMPLGAKPGGEPETPPEPPGGAVEPSELADKSAQAQAAQKPAGAPPVPHTKPNRRKKPRLIQ